jgi:hypothetical protein
VGEGIETWGLCWCDEDGMGCLCDGMYGFMHAVSIEGSVLCKAICKT